MTVNVCPSIKVCIENSVEEYIILLNGPVTKLYVIIGRLYSVGITFEFNLYKHIYHSFQYPTALHCT